MPLTVSTRKAWFSAPREKLSLSRARSTGVISREIRKYNGSERTTTRVSQPL
ncbi:hypothetical protein D3C76_518170 [compost metagenome]